MKKNVWKGPGRRGGPWLPGALAAAVLLGGLAGGGPTARAAEDGPMTAAVWTASLGQTGDASSPRKVIPVGRAVGLKLFSDGVMVVGFSQVPAEGGSVTPAKSCGLKEGDVITHINADRVDTIEEVQEELAQIGGEEMSIRYVRDGKEGQVTAQAVQCSTDGTYKLGAWLRDSMAGIGTVTYYDPVTGEFGALGHGVNDVDTAQLLPLESGGVLSATIADVKKGEKGTPGELHGALDSSGDIGVLTANTESGVFGTLASGDLAQLEPVEVADESQVKVGKATIYSNVAGDAVKAYEVEITKVFSNASDGRDLMLKVTDPELLAATGGIVQGMSGSPILQDGRLVGAVTHVLVSDPTQGYGILAQRMLKQGESCKNGQSVG